ncbi:ABC transporter ATP-binding protein [Clostridium estertheticum]|uniref:ABC transporter ATP-binding protein n=2 Tax=Clostridium estertheticum TaxID=238834 RepID=A0A7Y3SXN8_9CLOT|nr:ABC transporter ATP-binding protein [Clostridium estertheticum]NNU77072.1 ABC transporter ATP-binding protein [Clostridium estertheticum]WBL47840.1 ABC transporter ATP-binding protein [Clostridium estertheticum]
MQLSIKNISKKYGKDSWALKNFSIELENGVLGLLGPNGAGKSTLMKIITTITKPTEGKVLWNGVDIHEKPELITNCLGYLPQDFGVYPNLNAIDFLRYIAAVKGMDMKIALRRIGELIDILNLTDVAKKSIGSYSGGMKQRIGIAQALLNDPSILVVDEPTVGLDPEERVRFRNLISDLSGERIVILSTHIVSDLEATASDIVIINKGSLVSNCSIDQLLNRVENMVWDCVVQEDELIDIRNRFIISSTIRRNDGIHTRIISKSKPLEKSKNILATLEDAYLYQVNSNGGRLV